MTIVYRKLTLNDLNVFIQMRIQQLQEEEGADEIYDLNPSLVDYYKRHISDNTFVCGFGTPYWKALIRTAKANRSY